MNRRTFLRKAGSSAAAVLWTLRSVRASGQPIVAPTALHKKPDYHLTLEEIGLELAPNVSVKTIAYNGTVPGPVIRMKHGVPITIDVENKTSVADLVHWHGFDIDPVNDGAMEEGSPMINPGATQRYSFTPGLTGSRWYHTHNRAGLDFTRSTYTGQFGFAYVEPAQIAGDYDHEVFLPVHHWTPTLAMDNTPGASCGVAYKYASFNGRLFSASDPLKVREKQRVLFHFLNASATKNVSLALSGHKFRVLALDGNPVPNQSSVDVLEIAVAERVDAVVEMNHPGNWVLGSTEKRERESGLGLGIEYAGSTGAPIWIDPADTAWDYLRFGKPAALVQPDQTFIMVFGKKPKGAKDGMDQWVINGKSWPDVEPLTVSRGKRYRLSMLNASSDAHPVHLHRHIFEVMSFNGKFTSGILKDTINLKPFARTEVDFIANNPGPALFHCHHQLHMDYGFMQLIRYA